MRKIWAFFWYQNLWKIEKNLKQSDRAPLSCGLLQNGDLSTLIFDEFKVWCLLPLALSPRRSLTEFTPVLDLGQTFFTCIDSSMSSIDSWKEGDKYEDTAFNPFSNRPTKCETECFLFVLFLFGSSRNHHQKQGTNKQYKTNKLQTKMALVSVRHYTNTFGAGTILKKLFHSKTQ